MKIMCIYEIKNTINNKIYIGSTNNFRVRKNNHIHLLSKDKHPNLYLQQSWNKYSRNFFEFNILKVIENIDDLVHYEQKYIDEYKPEYNLRLIAESNRGIKRKIKKTICKLTIDQVKEIRNIYTNELTNYKILSKKYNVTSSTIENIIKNRTYVDENYKIPIINKKVIYTKERRQKLSDLAKSDNGISFWSKNNELTIEQRYARGNANRGKKLTNEQKNKLKNWNDKNYNPLRGRAKLTWDIIYYIREQGKTRSCSDISKELNINHASISLILRNLQWRDPEYGYS